MEGKEEVEFSLLFPQSCFELRHRKRVCWFILETFLRVKANYFRDSVSFVVLQFDFFFGGAVSYRKTHWVPCAGGGKMSTLALQR